MGTNLQEVIAEFGCTVLNYTKNKIVVDHFCSEERYNNFSNGFNCRAGMGLFDIDEVLQFNKINDNTLLVIQNDGIETARYKYVTIFKATMEYKDKKVNKSLTFRIRRNEFNPIINFIDTSGNSLDFKNVNAVKNHLSEKYGANKLTDWSVSVG
ncbi:MAG: hypothetical protein APF81_08075 [Desulfosporosinus sp. BRH_c37]|nr:MAG: hypothetical protein APF81_08075 [Desulfosporosinus sp. BRH_c37]